jgi:hypothetical protein
MTLRGPKPISLSTDRERLNYDKLHTHRLMGTTEASVRVSSSTLAELERFQSAIRVRTLDDAIRSLLALRRKELVALIYGSAQGIRPFRESDRVDADR